MSAFIQCVNIPRSGHHLLIRLLRSYYQGDDKRSDTFYYCGHYKACKSHPCSCREKSIRRFRKNRKKPLVTVQKSHDRHMLFPRSSEARIWEVDTEDPELKVRLDYDHIIQIRDPVMSTISDYRLCCGEFTTVDKWLHFAEIGMLYRKAFLEKWIIQNEYIDTKRYQVVRYEDIVNDLEAELARIIQYITPALPMDADAMRRAFEKSPVRARWSLDSFVFVETVAQLEAMISPTWERVRIITENLMHRTQQAGSP